MNWSDMIVIWGLLRFLVNHEGDLIGTLKILIYSIPSSIITMPKTNHYEACSKFAFPDKANCCQRCSSSDKTFYLTVPSLQFFESLNLK